MTVIISALSVIWSFYAAYCFPYWGSETILDLSGRSYRSSLCAETMLPSEAAIEDIRFCKKKISRIHPLYRKTQYDESEFLFQEAIDYVKSRDSITVNNLFMLIQMALASLGDAHTQLFNVNNSPRYAEYSDCDKILSVNGVPFANVIKEKAPLISSETREWTYRQINLKIRNADGVRALGYSLKDGIRVKYLKGEEIHERVFSENDYLEREKVSYSLNADRIGGYAIYDSISTAYLRMENLFYYKPNVVHRFNKSLEEMFSTIKERNLSKLIIDLRGNPGGNTAIIRELFKYLPIRRYSTGGDAIRRGPFLIKKKGTRKNYINNDYCFHGDVYVLTSVGTFSAATQLADGFQGNNLATIIGEPPGNAVSGFTNIVRFHLPNSHLSLDISTSKHYRVDESNKSSFLEPDIKCPAVEALKRAMTAIEK